jgi:hypothetical protein
MMDTFITKVTLDFQQLNYLSDLHPQIPGVQALMVVRSSKQIPLGFAKVREYFLFIDADNTVFNRLDLLMEIYKRFSQQVNLEFKTPHGLRILIPNIAIVAISQTGFSEEIISCARTTSLNPWYGGEVGQVILVDLAKQQIISLASHNNGHHPRPGAIPLLHASNCIRKICKGAFE